jgi:hypothetical protein
VLFSKQDVCQQLSCLKQALVADFSYFFVVFYDILHAVEIIARFRILIVFEP